MPFNQMRGRLLTTLSSEGTSHATISKRSRHGPRRTWRSGCSRTQTSKCGGSQLSRTWRGSRGGRRRRHRRPRLEKDGINGWWTPIGMRNAGDPEAAAEECKRLNVLWKAPVQRDFVAGVQAALAEAFNEDATYETVIDDAARALWTAPHETHRPCSDYRPRSRRSRRTRRGNVRASTVPRVQQPERCTPRGRRGPPTVPTTLSRILLSAMRHSTITSRFRSPSPDSSSRRVIPKIRSRTR